MIRVRRRIVTNPLWTGGVYAVAVLAGLLSAVMLISISGEPVLPSLGALATGAAGSPDALLSGLVTATPLMFTGLATVVVYRAGVWSVGQEGQVFAGAMAAYQMNLWVTGLPPALGIVLCVLAGTAGGALLGGLAAGLKARFEVSEIVSTVMLNYLIVYLLSFLLGNTWTATGTTASYQQTPLLPQTLWLPVLVTGSKLHAGFLVALAAALWLAIVLRRTALGYEIRGMGENAVALAQRGTDTVRTMIVVMLISGALSALAGVGEAFGVTHRLTTDNLANLGFNGIIIGMIGNLTPLGTVIAALVFGALHSGSLFMNVVSGVPAALITALQGVILIFFLIAGTVARFELVWDAK